MFWASGSKQRRTDPLLQTDGLSGSVKVLLSEVSAAEDHAVAGLEAPGGSHGPGPGLPSGQILGEPGGTRLRP